MHIKWNAQSCRWFENASAYTRYSQNLAGILKKYIPAGESLCDIGCGAALVDFALAEHCREITCVDISPEAVGYVEAKITARGMGNMRALCSNARHLEGQWDNVTALFFGGSRFVEQFMPLAKKQLILTTHAARKGNFGPEGHQVVKCSDIASTIAYLDSLGVKYTHEKLALEYGQPLGSLEEARAFARAYSRPMDDETLEAYLSQALVKTEDETYPYYLPNRKEFGLFVIRRDENEKLFRNLVK